MISLMTQTKELNKKILKVKFVKNIVVKNKAKRLATTSKSLDRCAAQIAFAFNQCGINSIRDKICLEIGSGWVLSHAIIFYLLGAKKVFATDIEYIVKPETIKLALDESIDSIIRDILSPYEDHEVLRKRIEKLHNIKDFNIDSLKELGIIYYAPIDFAKESFIEKVDFICSNSVLEHIPVNDIQQLLNNLSTSLTDGGIMYHAIHLEDHKDILSKPLDFLKINSQNYNVYCQTERGNRLRVNQWELIFSKISNVQYDIVYKFCRDIKIPDCLDEQFRVIEPENLKISHIGVKVTKVI